MHVCVVVCAEADVVYGCRCVGVKHAHPTASPIVCTCDRQANASRSRLNLCRWVPSLPSLC
jgi:vacuolar-type H+-ATPase subunit F/Vma7